MSYHKLVNLGPNTLGLCSRKVIQSTPVGFSLAKKKVLVFSKFGLKSDPASIIHQSGRIKKHYCKDSSRDVKVSQLK